MEITPAIKGIIVIKYQNRQFFIMINLLNTIILNTII